MGALTVAGPTRVGLAGTRGPAPAHSKGAGDGGDGDGATQRRAGVSPLLRRAHRRGMATQAGCSGKAWRGREAMRAFIQGRGQGRKVR